MVIVKKTQQKTGKNIGMKRKSLEEERGKRKESDKNTRDVEEEDEEEKMNAFYTLVRNIRDVHNQIVAADSSVHTKERMKAPTWTPSFTWEDFAGDEQLRDKVLFLPPSSSFSSSKNEEKQPETKKTQDFDLNLSL